MWLWWPASTMVPAILASWYPHSRGILLHTVPGLIHLTNRIRQKFCGKDHMARNWGVLSAASPVRESPWKMVLWPRSSLQMTAALADSPTVASWETWRNNNNYCELTALSLGVFITQQQIINSMSLELNLSRPHIFNYCDKLLLGHPKYPTMVCWLFQIKVIWQAAGARRAHWPSLVSLNPRNKSPHDRCPPCSSGDAEGGTCITGVKASGAEKPVITNLVTPLLIYCPSPNCA